MFAHSGFFYKKRVYFFPSLLYNATMKKLINIFFLILIVITCLMTTAVASADSGDFILITEENCKFYLFDQAARRYVHKFSIPTTYYVKVLDAQPQQNYVSIEYMGFEGYIENVSTAKHESNVQAPYHGKITVTPTVDLREGAPDSRNKYECASTDIISYVGEYVDGASVKWYALMLNNDASTLYYAEAINTNNPNVVITPHQNSVSVETPLEPDNQDKSNGGINNTVVRAILIIGIIIPAMIILFLIFKPGKKTKKRRYQDEDSHHYDDYDGYYRK